MYRICFFVCLFSVLFIACNQQQTLSPYEAKARELTSQLTLSEKVAQLKNTAHAKIKHYVDSEGNVNQDSLKKYFPYGVGGLNIDITLDPVIYVNVANSINKYNYSLRVPIPAMFIGEGLHGHMCNGATVFPQAIAMGNSWDPELLERVYDVTAREAASRGVRNLLSPVLDLGRDPRFGRIEEMYSEDTYLVSRYAEAAVYGFQGRTALPDSNHVAATLKHFVGHGMPEGGRNIAPVNISTYDLMNDHIPPFEAGINAGVLGVMPSYNEINGVPNHGSQWLLVDVLRQKLGFTGLLISDQNAIDELCRTHAVVPTMADAAVLAVNNTIDVDIRYFNGTYDELEQAVADGKISEQAIDKAVIRLLTLKYQLDLFNKPTIDPANMLSVINSPAHKQVALEAAEKSMVLLKNDHNLLPIDTNTLKTIAVIGPLAKGLHYGGYTAEPRRNGVDVLDGITAAVGAKTKVLYAEGCKLALEESSFWFDNVQTPNAPEADRKLIAEAVKTAKQSDVVVLALGETVAFSREAWSEWHLGDRENLDLLGLQDELVDELVKTGKPIVVLMFGGRPLSFRNVAQKIPSILQVYYPGQEGGRAIANVIFGNTNPSGKLATTIPASVGNLPCYYSRKPTRQRSYVNQRGVNYLYPFGHGLSYTTFEYSNLTIDKDTISVNDSVSVSVTVTNTGNRFGEEVVQLYIRDMVSSAVRPVMELKDFCRVPLDAGASKTVTFTVGRSKLEFYNSQLNKVVEPGEFKIMVGPSSVKVSEKSIVVL